MGTAGALGLGGPLGALTPPGLLPALGVLEYRVLSTNFRDYAIVFSQLEQQDEAFNTLELYSAWPRGGVGGGLLLALSPPPRPALGAPYPQVAHTWPARRP